MGASNNNLYRTRGKHGWTAAFALSLAFGGCGYDSRSPTAPTKDADSGSPRDGSAGAEAGADSGGAGTEGGGNESGGAGRDPAEGSSGFVSFNLVPDGECVISAEATKFLPIGLYDLSPGRTSNGSCAGPYQVNLLISSLLEATANSGGREQNILQVHSAEVKLMDLRRRPIEFLPRDQFPNPFLVIANSTLPPAQGAQPSTGVVTLTAIPLDYAAQLRDSMFVGAQILAEIQVFGTTTGDKDIDFRPFVYPIELCDGCLTLCISADIRDKMLDEADILDGQCQDNSGQDGRICIDPDC